MKNTLLLILMFCSVSLSATELGVLLKDQQNEGALQLELLEADTRVAFYTVEGQATAEDQSQIQFEIRFCWESGILANCTAQEVLFESGVYQLDFQVFNEGGEPVFQSKAGEFQVSVFSVPAERNIMMEKFTGTWCGWCPNGDWIADTLGENRPELIVVDVHWDDPLMIPAGEILTDLYANGSPSANFNRKKFDGQFKLGVPWTDWSEILEEDFGSIVPFEVEVTAEYDVENNSIEIEAEAKALGVLGGDFRLLVYVVENEFSTDDVQYGQVNYYDTVEDHPHFGWGDPVNEFPFTKVVREMIGGAWGVEGVIPAVTENQTVYAHSMTYTLDDSADPENYSIVVAVSEYEEDINDRGVINSSFAAVTLPIVEETPETPVETIATAETPIDTTALAIEEIYFDAKDLTVYPNPVSNVLNYEFIENGNIYSLEIYARNGQMVDRQANPPQNGSINVEDYVSGVYYLHLNTEKGKIIRKWLK